MKEYDLVFSSEADTDIEHILDYTLLKWGSDQLKRYQKKLEDAFLSLRSAPHTGFRHDHLSPETRIKISGKHYVVYKIRDETVFILRILHQSMDIGDAMNKDH